jgi:lipopolysaccharide transport system permease protein
MRMNLEPTVVIEPRRGLFHLDLAAIWEYRELLYFMVWRDIKIRYKQTAIGVGWAVLQPFVQMVIFTVIFGKFARIPSDDFPYSIFAYSALHQQCGGRCGIDIKSILSKINSSNCQHCIRYN